LTALIVLIVGYIGWNSNTQLVEEITSVNNHLEGGISLA
jgi:hypothetical protein